MTNIAHKQVPTAYLLSVGLAHKQVAYCLLPDCVMTNLAHKQVAHCLLAVSRLDNGEPEAIT